MSKKLHPLIKLDKSIAEFLLGHSPGRPTLSRRAGRNIGSALGVSEDTGTGLFHGALLVGALTAVFKTGK